MEIFIIFSKFNFNNFEGSIYMLQYFMPHKYKHILNRDCTPKLEYFCKVDEVSSVMPRAMHVHENLVEVLLVYEGSGIYTIDNNKYIAKKGDLIFIILE